jgi:hypothetical protein
MEGRSARDLRSSSPRWPEEFSVPPAGSQPAGSRTLPSGIAPCCDTSVLLGELAELLSRHVDLAEDQLRLTCNFVLYTWFQDVVPIAPYLWIIGPYGAGKTTLLALLHCLCRRGITSDFTPTALYALPGAIRPTLLIDEFEMSAGARGRDLLRLLRTGTTRNGRIFRGSKQSGPWSEADPGSRPADSRTRSRPGTQAQRHPPVDRC